jgi:hypothetical protein
MSNPRQNKETVMQSARAMLKEKLERELSVAYQQCTLNVGIGRFDRATVLAEKASYLHESICKLEDV